MAAEKSSFILYFGYRKHLALLSDEERGKLLMALFDYAESGQDPNLTGASAMAFSFIQDQMERDAKKYAEVCKRNRENGAKGGRPPKVNESDINPEKPKITERFSEKPKKPDNDNEYDNEYDNEDENESDTILTAPPTGESAAPVISIQEKRFTEFWAAYPKKVGKKAADAAWKKLKPDTILHDRIIAAVEKAKRTEQWQKENGRFIPNPTTWLNQGRWDDEYEEAPSEINSKHFDVANQQPATTSQGSEKKRDALAGFKTIDDDDFYK
ncbi:MAG: DUF6291 domain-containing protein [Oscillospiraceae bacterium]|nr:DUF6291 domain-containing protein [Oscillospiraceae bacterium]